VGKKEGKRDLPRREHNRCTKEMYNLSILTPVYAGLVQ